MCNTPGSAPLSARPCRAEASKPCTELSVCEALLFFRNLSYTPSPLPQKSRQRSIQSVSFPEDRPPSKGESQCAVAVRDENWPFPVQWPLLSFPNLLAYWVQHFHSIIFQALKYSTVIPSPPLALFVVMVSKAHLTSHSRMSGSRWVITPSWLSGSWRSFLYSLYS